MNLSLVSNLAPLPELQMLQSFQLQGASPHNALTGGSAPGPHWGSAPDPYIGSRSRACHDSLFMCNGAPQNSLAYGFAKP